MPDARAKDWGKVRVRCSVIGGLTPGLVSVQREPQEVGLDEELLHWDSIYWRGMAGLLSGTRFELPRDFVPPDRQRPHNRERWPPPTLPNAGRRKSSGNRPRACGLVACRPEGRGDQRLLAPVLREVFGLPGSRRVWPAPPPAPQSATVKAVFGVLPGGRTPPRREPTTRRHPRRHHSAARVRPCAVLRMGTSEDATRPSIPCRTHEPDVVGGPHE